jgi:NodT family efflux transporter outer membrane factor (OMF) lipoprotein
LALLMLSGCTLGPDYFGPPKVIAPEQTQFQRESEIRTASGPLEMRWWQSLHDDELTKLVEAAFAASPDRDAAVARLRQARAGLNLQRANLLPTTGAVATDLHLHSESNPLGALAGGGQAGQGSQGGGGQSVASGSSDIDFTNVGFDASWEVDLFGAKRRAVESAVADLDARQADLEGTQVSLSAEVAEAYVSLRDLQHRLDLAQASAELQGRTLDLTKLRLAGGTASDLDVQRLTTQVESTRADLVPLQAQIAAQLTRLAVLTGQTPGALDTELKVKAPLPIPPESVAIGDPASLLRRRPDICSAERRLASQNAVIGERIADYFPKLTLFGELGFGSTDVSQLLTSQSFSAVAAPVLQWTPFDFGRTEARVGQAEAARDEAMAQYRSTVLQALGDAETALSNYGIQRCNVAGLRRVYESATRAAELTRQRYAGGTASLIDVLDTERARLASEQAVAQAEAALTQDFIGLQKSLGLGWSAE